MAVRPVTLVAAISLVLGMFFVSLIYKTTSREHFHSAEDRIIRVHLVEDHRFPSEGANRHTVTPVSKDKSVSYRLPKNKFQLFDNDMSMLVYSAHYDDRDKAVKIVGLRRRVAISEYDLRCQFPDDSKEIATNLHNISVITYRDGLEYDTWVWQCEWKNRQPPSSMKFIYKNTVMDIAVSYFIHPDGVERVLKPMVCVKPMRNNLSDSYQLKEFLEMSKVLGVSKVALYDYRIHMPTIRPVLDGYVNSGYVDVHVWNLPVPHEKVHAVGQKAHNQHCLYTYMYKHKWIIFIDLDELVVPKKSYKSLLEMLTAAEKLAEKTQAKGSKLAGFNLRSQMCPTVLPDDKTYKSKESTCLLTSLRKSNCTPALDMGVWSKPIAKTEGCEIVDVHNIRKARSGYKTIDLDPHTATVHHYRNNMTGCQIVKESVWRNVRQADLLRFEKELKEAVGNMCDKKNPLAV